MDSHHERTLAKMNANQAEIKADREERKAEMKVNQEAMKTLISRVDIHQDKMEAAIHSMRRKETIACQETA
jgi:hypothetical protein